MNAGRRHSRISILCSALPFLAMLVPVGCSRYAPPRLEVSRAAWEHRFDIAIMSPEVWRPEGGAALHAGALETGQVPPSDQLLDPLSATRRPPAPPGPGEAVCLQDFAVPDLPREGRALRLEWTFTVERLGRGSQRVVAGPGLIEVEIHDGAPVLNDTVRAGVVLVAGTTYTFACDFDRSGVFSWRIDGVEQLNAPMSLAAPATANLTAARVRLGDPDRTDGATRWHWIRLLWVEPLR